VQVQHIDIVKGGVKLRATCVDTYWYAHESPNATTSWPFVTKWGRRLAEREARKAFSELAGLHYQTYEEAVQQMAKYYAVGGPGVPRISINSRDVAIGIPLPELLQGSGLTLSTSEARRLILQGGVRIAGIQNKDVNRIIRLNDFDAGSLLLQTGKHHCRRLVISSEAA